MKKILTYNLNFQKRGCTKHAYQKLYKEGVRQLSAIAWCFVLLVCFNSVQAQTDITDWSSYPGGAKAVCGNDNDIDNDNDGLIEICYLENLDAVRHQLAGAAYQSTSGAMPTSQGCPSSGCRGYELVRDLDFATDESYLSTAHKMQWTTATGWQPIGTTFTGIFDGNGNTLSNLFIRSTANFIGLFARTESGAQIARIGLSAPNILGHRYVGSLVGRVYSHSTITSSYALGAKVTGTFQGVGGLVGRNGSVIINSYTTATVSAVNWAGGLTGDADAGSVIKNSSAIGIVRASGLRAGGLTGQNTGLVIDSYADVNVSAQRGIAGGLVGNQFRTQGSSATIINSYSRGTVSGNNRVGGLVGWNRGTIANSYSTAQVNGEGGSEIGGLVGRSEGNEAIISNSYSGSQVRSVSGDSIGGLVGRNRTTIIGCYSSGSVYSSTGKEIGGLVGGNRSGGIILNSYSSAPVTSEGRLSQAGGLVGYNAFGTIHNSYSSGRVEASGDTAGGLVGWSLGSISNSYSSGDVHGKAHYVGGLVGWNQHSITNSYSSGDVHGEGNEVGGLVGHNGADSIFRPNDRPGDITNSYSISLVTGGGSDMGGLVGKNELGTITKSYWETTSTLLRSDGGTSKTTVELQSPTASTGIYSTWSDADWDFGTAVQYPAILYSRGTNISPQACGTPPLPLCASLLAGQRTLAVSTGSLVRVEAVEGEMIVLATTGSLATGNFKYSWTQENDITLSLATTNTANLRFLVPSDLVSETTTTALLVFRLDISTGTRLVQRKTVSVVVTKKDNGTGDIVLGPISRADNVLTAPTVDSLPDPDGDGMISSIRYQWQLCLAGEDCSSGSTNWTDTNGTAMSYSVQGTEARLKNRFRVVVSYQDGQGYRQGIIASPISYFLNTVSSAITFTGFSWNQFPGGAKAVCDDGDIDNDNDGLIELCYLEDIDEMRYALDGLGYRFADDAPLITQGCGAGSCEGYELVRDLDFAADDSYLSTANKTRWTTDTGWIPVGRVGNQVNRFSGIFEGNGYTLSNLRIDSNQGKVGLFSRLARGTVINGLGLLDVNVRGGDLHTGSLVGHSEGTVSNSYSSGHVRAGFRFQQYELGGLVGWNGGTVSNSYSSARVEAYGFIIGGLVGSNVGLIVNSYGTGQVLGHPNNLVGGLVGENTAVGNLRFGTIRNSYSTGRASGGLGGLLPSQRTTVSDSYWDTDTSEVKTSDRGGVGKTTEELQSPTASTGIYSTWSDADWDFGTAIQYPAIKYTQGSDANYPTCGMSQQRACGGLLAGQRIRQILISTASIRVEAVEGEMVVLNAMPGNFTYQWHQTSGTTLRLETADTAELRFFVPNDLVIGSNALRTTLTFQLTVSTATMKMTQIISVVVTKTNSGEGDVVGSIVRVGNILTASFVDLSLDPDGAGTTSNIRYQWQRCSKDTDCNDNWPSAAGPSTNTFYQIQDAVEGDRFRLQLIYRDGQGYEETVVSEEFTYSLLAIRVRLKVFLEGALQ